MRNIGTVLVGTLCATVLAGCSTSRNAAVPSASVAAVEEDGKDGIERANTLTVTAVVEAIDQKTRMVTLRGPDGDVVTFKAGDEVRNLAQVKKGDEVEATYYESLSVRVRKPGEATPGVTVAEDAERAKPGEKPGAAGARVVTVTATVEKIDRKKQTVTLRGPEGNQRTIKVKNPAHLEKVKVGDLVEFTFTEAVAIAVEKPGKR